MLEEKSRLALAPRRYAPYAGALLAGALLAGALSAGALSAGALPADLGVRSGDGDRIFAYQDGVLVTRQDRVEYFDARTLALTPIDTASGDFLLPLPGGGRDRFFYAIENPGLQVVGLRGFEKTVISQPADLSAFTGFGGYLFITSSSEATGQNVLASDGSAAGTGKVMTVQPGIPPCGRPCVSDPELPRFVEVSASGRIYYLGVYFNLFGPPEPVSLMWVRDAAESFPGLPPAPVPAPRDLDTFSYLPTQRRAMDDGRLFFFDEKPGRADLIVTDGVHVREISRILGLRGESQVHDLVELGGRLYFIAEKAESRELWRSDGTSEGTVMVHSFGAGAPIAAVWKHAGQLYLPVDEGGRGEELFVSDGSAAGTRLAFEIGPGPLSGRPRSFTPLEDGRFLIALDDGVHGSEPWISDGTREGSALLADARPGPLGSSPADLVLAAGRLFFTGETGEGRKTQVIDVPPSAPACPADRLCLRGGRFEVEATFTANGQSGAAQRSGSSSNDAGLFTFFSPGNWELMVKVLDGCNLNGRFWVFAAAATDVRFEIRVKDLESGQVKVYPFAGGPAPALADVDAFSTCPAN